jgi:hypothetical protein
VNESNIGTSRRFSDLAHLWRWGCQKGKNLIPAGIPALMAENRVPVKNVAPDAQAHYSISKIHDSLLVSLLFQREYPPEARAV